jgi:hypothetical protein
MARIHHTLAYPPRGVGGAIGLAGPILVSYCSLVGHLRKAVRRSSIGTSCAVNTASPVETRRYGGESWLFLHRHSSHGNFAG